MGLPRNKEEAIKLAQSLKPVLSASERIALEAGSSGIEGDLFRGSPDWERTHNGYPVAKLSEKEQAFFDGPVNDLCEMIDRWQIKNDKDLPKKVWDYIENQGFFGLVIPEKRGGKEFSAYAHSQIVHKIASHSFDVAVSVMVPNSLGPGELIERYGSDEQKDHYLPRLASGKEVPCFALTELHAGSDAHNITAEGIVEADENGKPRIRLNFEKRYITLAPVSTLLGLAFNLKDPDNLLGKGEFPGFTAALIPTDTDGLDISGRHAPLNTSFQNGPVIGKDVIIDPSQIIGGIDMAGEGWKMIMECLAIGRSISLPALSVAATKKSALLISDYSAIRSQFKLPLYKIEAISKKIAEVAARAYSMDAVRTLTTLMVDNNESPTTASAIVKYHATENARKSILDAMDILAGSAIQSGPRNLINDIYDAIPVGITVEGANIMTRAVIIYGMDAVKSHPYLKDYEEAIDTAAENNDLSPIINIVKKHAWFYAKGLVKSFTYGVTSAKFSQKPEEAKNSPLKIYYNRINQLSASFNTLSDVTSTILGGDLKKKQNICERLSDVNSNLYIASSILKKFQDEGSNIEDVPLASLALEQHLFEASNSLMEVIRKDNYIPKNVAPQKQTALKVVNFFNHMATIGISKNKEPSDNLKHNVAKSVVHDNGLRDRLFNGIFISSNENDPLNKLTRAREMALDTEATETKLRRYFRNISEATIGRALEDNIVTQDDIVKLEEFKKLKNDVLSVDSFEKDNFTSYKIK